MIISTAKSLNSKNWQKEDLSWDEFVQRLQDPAPVAVTYEDYMALTADERLRLKDVGGYVGGELRGKNRAKKDVVNRAMVALDVDDLTPQGFEALKSNLDMLYSDLQLVMHSTLKSRPEAPRVRLLIPIKHAIPVLEWNAISHRVAHDLELTADTKSYEPSQLMFWPTVREDQEYFFFTQQGKPLEPDDYLKKLDLNNQDTWPLQEGEKKSRGDGKNQDPRTKDNAVGLFCRTYDIHDAIATFLPEVYERTAENRYHYKDADAGAGAIVYDDGLFLHSHHETDPAKGQSNAFDLVRIHLYGELDKKEYDSPTDAPSYKAMVKFIDKDERCQRLKVREAAAEFAASQELGDWVLQLTMDKHGKPVNTRENHGIIIRDDPALRPLRFNTFSNQLSVDGKLPWNRAYDGQDWRNTDHAALLHYLDSTYKISSESFTDSALMSEVPQHRSFHPVKEYFESLQWDGQARARRFFIKYLGARDVDQQYLEDITEKWLLGVVARIYKPGHKFDNTLVLSGPQGIGKSQILRRLAGKGRWFCDSVSLSDMKEAKTLGEKIAGACIVEIPELNGLGRVDFNDVKKCLTSQQDTFRKAYAKEAEKVPRQCVFAATTNQARFNRDETGTPRRWWMMHCVGGISPTKWDEPEINISAEIDQIWAEVYQLYLAQRNQDGEVKLYLDGTSLKRATQLQAESNEEDGREPLVAAFLKMPLSKSYLAADLTTRRAYVDMHLGKAGSDPDAILTREWVTPQEIWCECFKRELVDLTQMEIKRIKLILTSLGWNRREREVDGWRKQTKIYGRLSQVFYVDHNFSDPLNDPLNDPLFSNAESNIKSESGSSGS